MDLESYSNLVTKEIFAAAAPAFQQSPQLLKRNVNLMNIQRSVSLLSCLQNEVDSPPVSRGHGGN